MRVFVPEGMKKFRLDGAKTSTPQAIEQAILDVLNGKAQPYLKSEPVPSNETGLIKRIVSDNFDMVVRNSSQDVLVQFYAPWCAKSKK